MNISERLRNIANEVEEFEVELWYRKRSTTPMVVEFYRRQNIELKAALKNIAFSAKVYARERVHEHQFEYLAKTANDAIDKSGAID